MVSAPVHYLRGNLPSTFLQALVSSPRTLLRRFHSVAGLHTFGVFWIYVEGKQSGRRAFAEHRYMDC